MTDFPLNPSLISGLAWDAIFSRLSPVILVLCSPFFREKATHASAAHEDHNYGIPKQDTEREREGESGRVSVRNCLATCKRGLPLCQVSLGPGRPGWFEANLEARQLRSQF